MKKFQFSLDGVLQKKKQEEEAALRELGVVAGRLNALVTDRDALQKTRKIWKMTANKNNQNDEGLSSLLQTEGPAFQRQLQDIISNLLQEEKQLRVKWLEYQKKFISKRHDKEKIITLKDQEYLQWKKAKKKSDEINLLEQLLRPYFHAKSHE